MDVPEPTPFVIDFGAEFSSNRTDCPITSYVLKTTNGAPETNIDDPSADEALIYSIAADTTTIELTPVAPGVYTFFLFAISGTGVWAVQEYSVTNYPCMPTIATIASSTDFTGIDYFQNVTENIIYIEIFADGSINPDDERTNEFTMAFPVFTNNDDTLCPLTYRFSSSDVEFTENTTLSSPTYANGEISLVVPVDTS